MCTPYDLLTETRVIWDNIKHERALIKSRESREVVNSDLSEHQWTKEQIEKAVKAAKVARIKTAVAKKKAARVAAKIAARVVVRNARDAKFRAENEAARKEEWREMWFAD